MSALVLLPPLSAPARRRHLVLVPPARRAGTSAAPVRRAGPARRAPRVPGPLHVTRRGRLALTLTVSTLLLVGATAALSAALVHAGPSPARTTSTVPVVAAAPAEAAVVVLPGDTLWSIADETALPGQDVRDVVLRIEELNGLSSSALSVGDTLLVPA